MASKKQYAQWCTMLIEGDDYVLDDIHSALLDDNFVTADHEWIEDEDDDYSFGFET